MLVQWAHTERVPEIRSLVNLRDNPLVTRRPPAGDLQQVTWKLESSLSVRMSGWSSRASAGWEGPTSVVLRPSSPPSRRSIWSLTSHCSLHTPTLLCTCVIATALLTWTGRGSSCSRSGIPHPHVVLDRRLLELCPRSVALLWWTPGGRRLVDAWVYERCPSDAEAFLCDFVRLKVIMDEVRG